MTKFGASLVLGLSLAFGGSAQAAFCYAPTAPSSLSRPDKPRKPQKPFCFNEFSKTNTCSDWEITNYNNEVRRYNDALRSFDYEVDAYLKKLTRYIEEAQAYAKCEVKSLYE